MRKGHKSMNAMLIVAIVIAVIGIIPVIIRKKLLKIYLTLLQNNDIKAIEDLIATKLAKICIPSCLSKTK